MYEKKRNLIVIIIFLTMIYLPNVSYLYFENIFPNINDENRQMATKPILSKETMKTYFGDYSKYYNDNLPYRTLLRRIYNKYDYLIFRNTNNISLAGKDDWMFYTRSVGDTSPVQMVQSKFTYDETFIKNNLEVIEKNFNYGEENRFDLYYLVLPNKENIYREYLPDYVNIYDNQSRAEKVISQINNDRIIYPKEELLAEKSINQVYYKTDTHWNSLGAFIGYKALIKTMLNKNINYEKLEWHDEKDSGDLVKLSGIYGVFNDSIPSVTYHGISKSEKTDTTKLYECYNSNATYNKTIMVLGDSYRENMIQYFYADFQHVILINRGNYSQEILKKYKPDIVVIEYVERSFPQIVKLYK